MNPPRGMEGGGGDVLGTNVPRLSQVCYKNKNVYIGVKFYMYILVF